MSSSISATFEPTNFSTNVFELLSANKCSSISAAFEPRISARTFSSYIPGSKKQSSISAAFEPTNLFELQSRIKMSSSTSAAFEPTNFSTNLLKLQSRLNLKKQLNFSCILTCENQREFCRLAIRRICICISAFEPAIFSSNSCRVAIQAQMQLNFSCISACEFQARILSSLNFVASGSLAAQFQLHFSLRESVRILSTCYPGANASVFQPTFEPAIFSSNFCRVAIQAQMQLNFSCI